MNDCMSFPPTWQDFVAQYQFRDSEEVYTNGSKLVPVFRIEQMMEHYHERIEKENERLVIKLNAEHIARQNTEIENARLRNLCKKLYDFAWFEAPTSTELNFAEDMKELGIGVD